MSDLSLVVACKRGGEGGPIVRAADEDDESGSFELRFRVVVHEEKDFSRSWLQIRRLIFGSS